jgi:hypothetical protein
MYQIEALLLNPKSNKQTEVVYRKSVHRKHHFLLPKTSKHHQEDKSSS